MLDHSIAPAHVTPHILKHTECLDIRLAVSSADYVVGEDVHP